MCEVCGGGRSDVVVYTTKLYSVHYIFTCPVGEKFIQSFPLKAYKFEQKFSTFVPSLEVHISVLNFLDVIMSLCEGVRT